MVLAGKDLNMEIDSDTPVVLVYSGGFLEKEDSFVALEFQSLSGNVFSVSAVSKVKRFFLYV